MITKVAAKDFKGLTFETPLEAHTLFIGPTGIGKSARAHAIQLTLRGYVLGGPKKNDEILNTYGNGNDLTVEVQVDGAITFGRRFTRGRNGAVSGDYLLNGRKATKGTFSQTLGEHGSPRVIDIAAFMELSAQKKIDEIFRLFPPGADIDKIDTELSDKKASAGIIKGKIDIIDGTVKRFAEMREHLELPAGNLAEAQAELMAVNKDLTGAREELGAAKIKAAADKAAKEATAKAEKDAEEKAQTDRIAKAKAAAAKTVVVVTEETPAPAQSVVVEAPTAAPVAQETAPQEQSLPGGIIFKEDVDILRLSKNTTVAASLQRILDTLDKSGCTACAARMIIKMEIRRYQ